MGGASPVFPERLWWWDGRSQPGISGGAGVVGWVGGASPVFSVFPEGRGWWDGRSRPGVLGLTCLLHLLHRFGDLSFKSFGLIRRHRGRHRHHCGDRDGVGDRDIAGDIRVY